MLGNVWLWGLVGPVSTPLRPSDAAVYWVDTT